MPPKKRSPIKRKKPATKATPLTRPTRGKTENSLPPAKTPTKKSAVSTKAPIKKSAAAAKSTSKKPAATKSPIRKPLAPTKSAGKKPATTAKSAKKKSSAPAKSAIKDQIESTSNRSMPRKKGSAVKRKAKAKGASKAKRPAPGTAETAVMPANSTGNSHSSVQIGDDELRDLFKYCDLPTRCKLRRVNNKWKQVVSQPEVNETVLVDWSCLVVSNPVKPSGCRTCLKRPPPGTEKPGKYPTDCHTPNDDCLHYGWYNVEDWEQDDAKYRNLEDHKRQGLLGPHVRTLIFDGTLWGRHRLEEEIRTSHGDGMEETGRCIQSIGMFCPNVEHLVIWRTDQHNRYKERFKRSYFAPKPPSALPQPKRLTVVSSLQLLAYVEFNDDHCGPIRVFVPYWTDTDNQSDEDFARQFLVCSPARRAWLVKYAPLLPEEYHESAKDGVEVGWGSGHVIYDVDPGQKRTLKIDLKDASIYQSTDPRYMCFLWALVACVQHEKQRKADSLKDAKDSPAREPGEPAIDWC